MRLIWGTSADGTGRYVGGFVAARIQHVLISSAFGDYAACGVIDGNEQLIGGVVFNSYQPACRSIELSFASDTARWLTRPVIGSILAYPFTQLDCQRVTALTPRKAASARRFLEKFGFKREGIVRRGFGNDDAVISGLLAEEWRESRFNPGARLDGQAKPDAAACA